MAARCDTSDRTDAFRRLLPALRRAATEVARSGELHGHYTTIATSHGECELAVHRGGRDSAPTVVELHGGGFVVGDVAANDAIRERLRQELDCVVVGVGYCLAPEYPYPHALDQLEEVLAHLAESADEYGLDPSRIALLGFSAGANLATVTAMRAHARHEERYRIVAQVLHYPFLDAAGEPADKNPQPWDIPAEMMAVFDELYVPRQLRRTPEVSPVVAAPAQLTGLPPTQIVAAGRDALAGEARSYADQLTRAGVSVSWLEQPHAHHGYVEQWFGVGGWNTAGNTAEQRDPRSQPEAVEAINATARFLAERFSHPRHRQEGKKTWTSD